MSEDRELRAVVIKLIRAVAELHTVVSVVAPNDPVVQDSLRDSFRAIEDAISGFEMAAHERS